MPSRKKKYNARFPAGRIKKIMQSDEEIGKVAKAVPVIISKTLELFVETLLAKTLKITNSRNAKTLSPSHMKQCIMSEKKFDFLRDLVKNIPDISVAEEAANYQEEDAAQSSPDDYPDSDTPYDLSMPSTSASKRILARSETVPNGSSSGSSSASSALNSTSHMMELQRSLSQNGYVSSNRAAGQLKRETDIVQRLQQHIDLTSVQNAIAAASSVIKHTTSIAAVNSDYLPNKLLRSDGATTTNNTSINRSPSSKESTITTATNSTPPSKIQNAIPAPIVSFDFCNKPVVKIDYSNLPLTSTSTNNSEMTTVQPIAPLSAPAQLHDTSSMKHKLQTTAFDFNAASATVAPVINIDLSNIVPPITLSNAADNAPSTGAQPSPAIAKITIGNLPAEKVNSKVNDIIATSINTAVAAAAAAAVPATAITSNSLDLDEDYDNI